MIHVPKVFQPKINTVYPHENYIEFERWFLENCSCDVNGREYLPILFCGYHVNNNYGQDTKAKYDLQAFVNELDSSKKYYCISQYDDGVGVDWKGKDVLEFNMSKKVGYPIPLMCQPHSYNVGGNRKYFASFVGNKTHEIRSNVFSLEGVEGYYVSAINHNIHNYCRVISQSIFGLCPRGYGINSFRIVECLQYGTIPVYISDEFIFPYNMDFEEYGVVIEKHDVNRIDEILKGITPEQIIKKQDKIQELYNSHFTYKGVGDRIIEYLCSLE